jgi:hypothetical protein
LRSSVRDGGIPGLAGFSLVGLLLVLVGVAVVGLRPWAPASVIPSVAISPDLKTGIAESVALRPEQAASVADASVVRDEGPKIATAKRVSRAGQVAPDEPKAVAVSVVSPAQRVAGPGNGSAPSQPAQPETPVPAPVATPSPQPPPPSTPAAPVVASAPESSPPRGPITSGGGGPQERGCAGDEYVLVISPAGEETDEPPSQLEIRIEYFGSDGSYGEFSLQGDEEDVRELVALLSEEGDCVRVEEEPAAEEPAEVAEDEPEAGAVATEPIEAPEPALP